MAKNEHPSLDNQKLNCLNMQFPFALDITFPGDLEYIPAIRKFVAEILQVSSFSPRFAYRSEIIVDEICNNAVVYGCHSENAEISLSSRVGSDNIEFIIKDQGGTRENITRLKKAVTTDAAEKDESINQEGLGLEIVRMLSERMDVVIDENNLTSVHIVRKREDERNKI